MTFTWGDNTGWDAGRWPTGIVRAGFYSGNGLTTPSLGLGVWGGEVKQPEITLNDGATATRASFKVGELSAGGSIRVNYYDADGKLVFAKPYTSTNTSSYFVVNDTMPEGQSFSKIVLTAANGGWSGEWVWLDDFQFDTISAKTYFDVPQTQQVIDTGVAYLGDAKDNTFVVANVSTLTGAGAGIYGNGGLDTLKLSGTGQTLDLTALAGTVQGVEVIDLTGTGNNTLKLSLADVMNNGAINQFVADGRVQMMVKGNAGDAVTLSDVLPNGTDPGDWVKKANVTVGGVVYEVYQHSGFGAELLVQQGVTVTLQNAGAGTFNIEPEVDAYVLDHATQAYTESDDTLIARLGYADRLEGGAGNDTFMKVGTGDTVHGGAGDDVIRVHSGDFERIDGGLGIDTLVMDGKAMHIDLSALGAKVQGVEKFDLGAGGNTLALSTHDVLAGGARDMVVADGKVQMLVNGANGEVDLLGGTHGDDGWTQGSNATVGGVTYHVYTNLAGTAELLVEDKVHVTIL